MKKQKEKLLSYCPICKTEYSCTKYETGIAHQFMKNNHTPKQDKPQEEYRMTEICPKCGKSTSTRITTAEQERDEILNSKELRVSPLCKDCQPQQEEYELVHTCKIENGYGACGCCTYRKVQPPQKECCSCFKGVISIKHKNGSYSGKNCECFCHKIGKVPQKEGWEQISFWTDKPKEVLIAIHKVKDAHFDDMVVMTGKQHASSMLCPMCGIRHSSLATERQKVEEMIREKISNCTGMEDNDGRFYYDADEIDEVFEQLRTNKGGREG